MEYPIVNNIAELDSCSSPMVRAVCPRCSEVSVVFKIKAGRMFRIKRCHKCLDMDDKPKESPLADVGSSVSVKDLLGEGSPFGEDAGLILSKMNVATMMTEIFNDDELRVLRLLLTRRDKKSVSVWIFKKRHKVAPLNFRDVINKLFELYNID